MAAFLTDLYDTSITESFIALSNSASDNKCLARLNISGEDVRASELSPVLYLLVRVPDTNSLV